MDPTTRIQAQAPESTGDKLARRLNKAGHNIVDGAAHTAHGAAKTIVNAPLAAGEGVATVAVVGAGAAVLTAEAAGAGAAAATGVAVGLGVDAVELTGKAAQATGKAAEKVGDATAEARKQAGSLLARTAARISELVEKGFDAIGKAFSSGVDIVSPAEK